MLAVRAATEAENSGGLLESGFEGWLEAEMERGRYLEYVDVPPEEPFSPDPAPPAGG
jgi:hypothetical protein